MTLVVAKGAVRLRQPNLGGAADAVALIPRPGADDGDAAIVTVALEVHSRVSGQGRPGHPGERLLGPWPRRTAAGSQIDTGIAELDAQACRLIGRGAERLDAAELIAKPALADH